MRSTSLSTAGISQIAFEYSLTSGLVLPWALKRRRFLRRAVEDSQAANGSNVAVQATNVLTNCKRCRVRRNSPSFALTRQLAENSLEPTATTLACISSNPGTGSARIKQSTARAIRGVASGRADVFSFNPCLRLNYHISFFTGASVP